MEKQKQTEESTNALWKIRNEQGFEIKQVAKLMGHRSSDAVEGYENGKRPNLENTIKLMLIYDRHPRDLFPEMYDKLQSNISKNLQQYWPLIDLNAREEIRRNIQFCTYENILEKVPFTQYDHIFIRNHVTDLAEKLGRKADKFT